MEPRAFLRRVGHSIETPERRARTRAKLWKSALNRVGPARTARPILVAGMQRSGTGMLMNVFHLHPSVAVFDEAADSSVFSGFRVRDVAALRSSLGSLTLPVAAYKIISDSHLVSSYLESFPDSRVIWMYRRPTPNARSQLAKFPHATRAIRLVHAGEPGGGWFAEGASLDSVRTLRELPAEELDDLDWACLNWWVRNRSYYEQGLPGDARVRLLNYETVTAAPRDVLGRVTDWLELPRRERAFRFVRGTSAREADLPALHPAVDSLCRSLLRTLDSQQQFDIPAKTE